MGRTGERALWSWDIEANEWDKVTVVTAVSDRGDEEVFEGDGALEKVDTLMRKAQGNWGAHASGIYDTLLLMNVREKPFDSLLVTGASVLMAKEKNLRVRDTFRWFLNGLAKVGKYVDQREQERPHPRHEPGYWHKKDIDRQRMSELSPKEVRDYCLHDSRILLEGMVLARQYLEDRGARQSWTSGASAVSLIQCMEPSSWKALKRYSLDFEDAQRLLDDHVVHGARVESWASGRVSGVYCYDIKSAYPAAYADKMLGLGARKARPTDLDAIWHCRWKGHDRSMLAPALDARTKAGVGVCQNWLVREEIEDLNAAGIAVERIEGWAPEVMFPIGQLFCRDLFAEKELGSFFAKVFLNSLHGKFTESVIKEAWKSGTKPTEWFGPEPTEDKMFGGYWKYLTLALDKKGRVPCHVQPLAGAMILGRTRSSLYRLLLQVLQKGGQIYYSDTDSLHCSLAPSDMPMELGTAMGDLAFEGGPYDAIYLGPKAYCLAPTSQTILADGKNPTLKGAMKGVPWASLDKGIRDHDAKRGDFYRQARAKDERSRVSDLRLEMFERVLQKGSAQIQKEGIQSFRSGVKEDSWHAATQIRQIQRTGRGKEVSGTRWRYLSPEETPHQVASELPLEPFDEPDEE